MLQDIHNESSIEQQLNVGSVEGDIILSKKTRFAKRFESLKSEVLNDKRYDEVMDSLKYYITKLDGVDMSTKLRDGGFSEGYIISATRRKQKYEKKLERHKFFESAQWIDSQLFAKIKIEFEAHVEPLIFENADKKQILCAVVEYVINPILVLINDEGESDEFLNYDAEDIYGMIYYLTGKCHINWKEYDCI